MNDVISAIKNRRSIRKFREDQISGEEIGLILEAAIWAPTAHNDQPWHFTVIQNPETLAAINAKTRTGMAASSIDWVQKLGSNQNFLVTYNAPTLVIVSGRRDATAWQPDCAAAIQNMLLAAESVGVGSVWLGLLRFYFNGADAARDLGIPEGYEPWYGVSFGYKAEGLNAPAPKRNADVVTWIR